MRTQGIEDYTVSHVRPKAAQLALMSDPLRLVTAHEIHELSDALAKGHVPRDLETKLMKLALGDLGRRYIERNCRMIIALLQAAQQGSFGASREECERLLRVLAYVRKDDDAIADYRPDGFADDQQEIRVVATELDPVFQSFKSWRLRHQVPGMWRPEPIYRFSATDLNRS